MKRSKKLSYEELSHKCDFSKLDFKSTKEVEPIFEIIGQNRAEKAMEFGLNIDIKGYNIYMSGPTGVGKTSYALNHITEIAKGKEIPNDWCYVYNFENKSHPRVLEFEAGQAKLFAKDIDKMVEDMIIDIPKMFNAETYDAEKIKIVRKYQLQKDEVMKELKKKAKDMGFVVKSNESTIYFMPIVNGETLDEEKYNELSEKKKDEINKKSMEIQVDAEEIMKSVRELDKNFKSDMDELEKTTGDLAINHHIVQMKKKYEEVDKVDEYLDALKKDVIENIREFLDEEGEAEEESIIPWTVKKDLKEVTRKYKVNLFIDNSKLEGAPVVIDSNPTYDKLIGKVEYENEMGNLVTDFEKIKPGLLHKANGGYLILQAKDLLSNQYSWEALKRALKLKEIHIESLRDQYSLVSIVTLKPEEIPLDVKVVLVGGEDIYHMLYDYDEEFNKYFKVRVDFNGEMENNAENALRIAEFVRAFVDNEKTNHFNKKAVEEIIKYSSRMCESRDKLSTKFNKMIEILSEAATFSKLEGKKLVTDKHVERAIVEREYRSNLYEERMRELTEKEVFLIDTKGEAVGQINGLAVLDTGDYTFGRPQRITATTYMGGAGVVNIEKEADLSGNIHDKGINILGGYLGQKYAQEFPLTLSCRIAFEQSYGGVDGDSASSTELYAILSSLSDLPITQEIAVTGSINQKGEIQPIGGVNHKIEGFYKLCKHRGLTGNQGVIIPYQNVNDLVLKDEVMDSIKKGKFSVYAIKNIEEGIEILTGAKAGKKGKNGKYPKDSIHGKVYDKLTKFHDNLSKGGK
ncbi:MAG: AAA family ATPase [Clostridia bacterium]|jgi:lon-related putative ATP-dependent protease|nr:AAA family ATPase [Clostridia bacterium]